MTGNTDVLESTTAVGAGQVPLHWMGNERFHKAGQFEAGRCDVVNGGQSSGRTRNDTANKNKRAERKDTFLVVNDYSEKITKAVLFTKSDSLRKADWSIIGARLRNFLFPRNQINIKQTGENHRR